MIQRPQFKPHFHIEIIKGEGVFLISEAGHSVLSGQLFERVAGLVDGRRTADELVDALEGRASAAEVYYALAVLEKKGYLSEANDVYPPGEAVFWSIQNVSPQVAQLRLAENKVSVSAFGKVAVNGLVALLQSLHVQVDEAGLLGVVVTDDYLRKELRAYNQDALRSGRPWMLIKPMGAQMLIGPFFDPYKTGCWECLAHRMRINRTVEGFVERKQNRDEHFSAPQVATEATEHIAYGVAATEIARRLVREDSSHPEAQVLSIDVYSWRPQLHTLTRQPQCKACGDPMSVEKSIAFPMILESRKKAFIADGGHRAVTPQETLQKYEHHVSPITGAVSGLQRYSISDDGIVHLYTAGQNSAAAVNRLDHIRWHSRNLCSGKGTTDLQARASGLCEALERYSGVFQGTETRRSAKMQELAGLAIHPNDCMLFSLRQYRERATLNTNPTLFHYVPLPFDEEMKVEWTPVWSLTHKTHRHLPTAFCYYAYPSKEGENFAIGCSNGNAAGNTLEEAILQGCLELVERDSVALWWYNRIPRPRVDLDSFDEPYLRALLAFLKNRHRELWVLDLTSDLGIPVFAAIARRTDHPQEQVMLGFGAHLDARIGILRAVTELNQMLVWLVRDDKDAAAALDSFEQSETLTWLKTATIANQPYLAPSSLPPRMAHDYPECRTDDLREDVLFCQSLVEKHGMEMLVLDQTRPDIGLPVVKVIVPGLRHFWARFAPGRLYDAPVNLGWLPKPLPEEELNPIPMFL